MRDACKYGMIWCVALLSTTLLRAQSRPKLVVGITVDQMRWDYLHRFKHRWHPDGGIRRMLDKGFNMQHTSINYLPSYTACGHASIFTGSVPALHGITGNQWFDLATQNYQYCTGDTAARTVGSKTDLGQMSPVHLLTSTIADELKLATTFQGKTIGIALKDRGGILPAGHTANAAYWYDSDEGRWISSTYYMTDLPDWANRFNGPAKVDSLFGLDWHLLYKEDTYTVQPILNRSREARAFGTPQRKFPQGLKRFIGKQYDMIATTPHGNTLTTEFAKACIAGEQLGADSITDMICISYSAIDYLGHAYGPMSLEMEDAMLRLDIELGAFFRYLDKQVGEGAWMAFLTADHGVAQVPSFGRGSKLPAGNLDEKDLGNRLNEALKSQFGLEGLSKGVLNQQVILNIELIRRTKKLSVSDVQQFITTWMESQPGILRVVRLDEGNISLFPEAIHRQIKNGYYPRRSGHLQLVYLSGYVEGMISGGTSHGTGYSYDTRIPLLWYGWKIPQGSSYRSVSITDIAPTVAALLDIQEPSGCIGDAILEIVEPTKNHNP